MRQDAPWKPIRRASAWTAIGAGSRREASSSDWAFRVTRLTNPKSANNTVFMNLNRTRRDGTVFLDLAGNFKAAEVAVLADAAAKAEKTDVLHTGQRDVSADSASAARRVIWKAGDALPVEVPVGTTGLEFRLGDRDDSLREITLWYVDGFCCSGDRPR